MASSFDKDIAAVREMYSTMELLLEEPADVLERRTAASGWTVSEQIQHILLANRWAFSSIIAILSGRGDFAESGRMSLLGKVLMRVGRIPRGRAKAPSLAEPVADVSLQELSVRLRKQREYLDRIASQREEVGSLKQRFRHPLLGEFSARDGVRFVRVHTDHHLRIVREIMHAVKSP